MSTEINHNNEVTSKKKNDYTFFRVIATLILSAWVGISTYLIAHSSISTVRDDCSSFWSGEQCSPMEYATFEPSSGTMFIVGVVTLVALLAFYKLWLYNKHPRWTKALLYILASIALIAVSVTCLYIDEKQNNKPILSHSQEQCVERQLELYINEGFYTDDCDGATNSTLSKSFDSITEKSTTGMALTVLLWLGYAAFSFAIIPRLHRS